MEHNFPYKSLHDYLDFIFKEKTPNENEIIQAKKTYWKTYNTILKKKQRNQKKEVTISLNKETLKLVNLKLTTGQSISDYLKKIINQDLQNEVFNQTYDKEFLLKIEQLLFTIIDYLESIIYQRKLIDNSQLTILEKHLEHLQKLMEEKF